MDRAKTTQANISSWDVKNEIIHNPLQKCLCILTPTPPLHPPTNTAFIIPSSRNRFFCLTQLQFLMCFYRPLLADITNYSQWEPFLLPIPPKAWSSQISHNPKTSQASRSPFGSFPSLVERGQLAFFSGILGPVWMPQGVLPFVPLPRQ